MKIYYYFTKEREGNELERFTYHFIQLETFILKVRSPFPGSILGDKASVSIMRPDVKFITRLNSFYYEVDLEKLIKKVKFDEKVNQNIMYLLEKVKDYENNQHISVSGSLEKTSYE